MSYHLLDDQVRVLVEGGVMRRRVELVSTVKGAAPSVCLSRIR